AGKRGQPMASGAALGELSPGERETLALLFTQSGDVPAHALGLTWPDLEPLLERRLVERDGEAVRLVSTTREAVARGALSLTELAKAQLRAADWYALAEQDPGDATRLARVIHHLVLGREPGRAEAMFQEASAALATG